MTDLVEFQATALARHSYWIIILPLLSFVINGLWFSRTHKKVSAALSVALSAGSMLYALALVGTWFGMISHSGQAIAPVIPWSWNWLPMTQSFGIQIGMLLDPISAMMLVVVTVIAFLVHIYSVGYMKDDPAFGRFFPLLSLFAFAMLGLVISTNLLQMYVFWELVGVSSYALIGFWYHKPSAVAASKKAFIVTRFADAFFLLGIVIVAWMNGSVDFLVINTPEAAASLNRSVSLGLVSFNALSLATVLIFTGGWGKSAMFPMHVWLPDAMEGPTPVSSIIHSATMVVAGVYLTARMFPLFSEAQYTLDLVMWIGAFTAAFAAIIAITQKDIKRILAFSTLSQLGYMMFSLGAARLGQDVNPLGYSASMFHVFTHAFFKCMLFLGAGAIIHTVHSNDLDQMGGLRKKMPWTYGALLIACLAIAGVPPFAGFFSKDEILLAALQGGHYAVFGVGTLVGGLTAFYMFRFFFLIFHGKSRAHLDHHNSHDNHGHHVENPWMTIPIVILAIPAALAGLVFHHTFSTLVIPPMALPNLHLVHAAWVPWLASAMGLGGIALAWFFYARPNIPIHAILDTESRPAWYQLIYNKFHVDEAWLFVSRKVIIGGFSGALKWADRTLVDGTMDLIGNILQKGGSAVRLVQNGSVALYLGIFFIGFFFVVWFGNLPLM